MYVSMQCIGSVLFYYTQGLAGLQMYVVVIWTNGGICALHHKDRGQWWSRQMACGCW